MERWHLVTPRTPGKTRRNQLSLVGIRSAGAAGWLQEQCRTSHQGRAKSLQGSRPFSLSAGIWGYAPQEPLQPSLSCRQAWNHPFPQHTHPGLIHPLTKATTLLHRPIMQTSHHPQPDHHRLGPGGAPRLCTDGGRAHRHSFSLKSHVFSLKLADVRLARVPGSLAGGCS